MKKFLGVMVIVSYLAMHIYFAYYAFTTFKLWIALGTFLLPVVGDLMLCGFAIGLHNWLPIIILTVVGALYYAFEAVAEKVPNDY